MSSSAEFGCWLDEMAPALDAWGQFVVSKMVERVEIELGKEETKKFFKINPTFRRKDKFSALQKVSIKKYSNPKEQMTDLVGARFVVLLKSDMDVLEKVLIEYPGWVKSKDRDPNGEQNEKPKYFDYQSVHYLVRPTEDTEINGITVPANLACEVQIRTVLQHAYAELVHDKFYKGVGYIPPTADRLIARCMALMETTDSMFMEAVKELAAVNKSRDQWCAELDHLVGPLIPNFTPTSQDADALEILEEFRDLIDTASVEAVRAKLSQPVSRKIKQNQAEGNLYAKPVVLMVYWLLDTDAYQVTARWPVPALRPGFNQVRAHLGIAGR